MNRNEQILYGSSIKKNIVQHLKVAKDILVTYPGRSYFKKDDSFDLSVTNMNQHILLLGGSGCGKTNTFLFTIEALRQQLTEQDVMLIFDTKGEFYDKFHQPGDIVFGNSDSFRKQSATWNIFDEILIDGDDPVNIKMNAREIAASLFHGRGSSQQPFFCNAARDIFMGILLHFIRSSQRDPEVWQQRLNNECLIDAFSTMKVKQYLDIFNYYEDMHFMLSYFGDGTSNQALGVFGELHSMISEYFLGIVAEHKPENSISMRQFVRKRGGRAFFLEYDLAVGETLTPIYRLLVDQALKEGLGRATNNNGRFFIIADEFKLLPKLQHIDDALNFGRGLGVYLMAGIQSIDQLYDIYGKEKGAVIASGFGSLIAYHTNDASSRSYISERLGSNVVVHSYLNNANDIPVTQERNGKTAEEWDQIALIPGMAIVSLNMFPPFVFRFAIYD